MAGFFRRLFSLGAASAHGLVDKLEDPVKMTEQGIRELKSDLDQALKSFAEVKAIAVRAKSDIEKNKNEIQDWERKAMALLQSGQSGKMDMQNAERLAGEALTRKEENTKRLQIANQEYEKHNHAVQNLQSKIQDLRNMIGKYENELITLKARSKTASATAKINKQLSSIDSNGTVAMLERMKEKVEQQEALSIAYEDIAKQPKSVDDEINQALKESNSTPSSNKALEDLKAKMGINN